MRWLGLFCLSLSGWTAFSQSSDSTRVLSEVIVKSYASNKSVLLVPAAIAVVDSVQLQRFNNQSLVSAFNTIAGVRMEERSPGSYRIAIRGSSLRAPFGIRNVKFYWNGLPLTDGGGNTYLNLLDNASVEKIEILKGPSGSLYGAGTGGVILLNGWSGKGNQISIRSTSGSYGLFNLQAVAQGSIDKTKVAFTFAHQQSEGYRQNSSTNRDAFSLQLQHAIGNRGVLSSSLFYTDLFYQTPGGLTQAQYEANPAQARVDAASKKAAVYNKTFFGGLSYDHQWNDQWSIQVGAYGSVTDFVNPTFLNYEKRKEENAGGRVETHYSFSTGSIKGKLTIGGEAQFFHSPIRNYDNVQGNTGNLQAEDEIDSRLLIGFSQVEVDLPKNYSITVGSSYTFIDYKFNRLSTQPNIRQQRGFTPSFSPRVAILKKWSKNLSVYGSISKGFSPPTAAEVRPSTSSFNDSLQAETGLNYEVGVKGSSGRFSYEVALYYFALDQTIVVQRLNNADYFINSGNTDQKGAEVTLAWTPFTNRQSILRSMKWWSSFTWNEYRFGRYNKNGVDFSGKQLTGVPPTIFFGGVDLGLGKSFTFHSTIHHTDRIPLNDSNVTYASDYLLLGAKLNFTLQFRGKQRISIWVGADNLLDQTYSLGNDLNAAGNRFFNAAAKRNYFVGLSFSL
ncbi:MAG: TonB-dependent receptor [Cyclobacteriaceae bacterium]|nr:TonB-dependent receptor [Cyclobacteriaceae bacterium]